MIRYLSQQEKNSTRELYSKCFADDSESFKDFYFNNKTKNNLILVEEDAIGQVRSMANLNPYKTKLKDTFYTTNYIVAVATDKMYRRQGLMRKIIKKMLNDMHEERKPFTWLMPAKEEYYKPFGFEYIYDKINLCLKDDNKLIRKELSEKLLDEAIDYINSKLSSKYDVFCYRDKQYFMDMIEEVKSEGGIINLLYEGSNIVGIIATVKEVVREIICNEEYVIEKDARPTIMARIVDLKEFTKHIHLGDASNNTDERFVIRIVDKIIEDNDGVYYWNINKKESNMEKITKDNYSVEEIAEILKLDIDCISIGEFTQWMFGYRKPETISWEAKVETLHGAFFDEVV